MRLPVVFCTLIAAAGMTGAAQAQSRYGPASPIPPPPPGARTLAWPGKVEPPSGTSGANRPQPLSPWARAQSAAPAPAALPLPPSLPAPMVRTSVAPAPVRAAPVQPAPAPMAIAAATPAPRPTPAPPAPSPTVTLPPPQALAAAPSAAPASTGGGFRGYGVPQIPFYPGMGAPAAPPVAAPPPGPQAMAQPQGARLYSVSREFGMQPDLIQPRTPLAGAESLSLSEIPEIPQLRNEDNVQFVPARPAPDEGDGRS